MHSRIVSLAPSSTEILFALGAGKSVIARSDKCDYPEDAAKLPAVGRFGKKKDLAFLGTMKPDCIVTAHASPALASSCKQRDIALVVLAPQSLQDIYDSIWSIARLAGKEHKADDLVFEIETKLEKIASHAPAQRRRVYCEEWHSPPTVAAAWVPQLVEHAGGTPLAAANNESYEVSFKEVSDFDPDHVVLHWRNCGAASRPDEVKRRRGWSSLRAIAENRVHVIDEALLNRPGPRIWRGAEELQKILKA